MPTKYASMADRLLANSVNSRTRFYDGTPCREWFGRTTTNRSGNRYGRVTVRVKSGARKGKVAVLLAHRVAIVHLKGRKLTKRQVVMHLCNNTICINPLHIVGGTQSENIRQCVREGRHVTPLRVAA